MVNIGGYLHPLYNDLVNSKGLVHQEQGTNVQSVIGNDQINAVNYLNGQEFEINEEMLMFLLKGKEMIVLYSVSIISLVLTKVLIMRHRSIILFTECTEISLT